MQKWVEDLNRLYRSEPAMDELDCDPAGFEWVDCNDSDQCVLALLRKGNAPDERVLVVCNFTPVPRPGCRVGIDTPGFCRELLNSDASVYGGSGMGNAGGVEAENQGCHGRPHSILLKLPPLAALFLKAPRIR